MTLLASEDFHLKMEDLWNVVDQRNDLPPHDTMPSHYPATVWTSLLPVGPHDAKTSLPSFSEMLRLIV